MDFLRDNEEEDGNDDKHVQHHSCESASDENTQVHTNLGNVDPKQVRHDQVEICHTDTGFLTRCQKGSISGCAMFDLGIQGPQQYQSVRSKGSLLNSFEPSCPLRSLRFHP